MTRASALDYVLVQPDTGADAAAGTVVFLHNRDASMLDFARLADAIDPHHYTYVFPNAPFGDPSAPDSRRSWHAPGESKAVGPASRAWPCLVDCLRHLDETLGAGRPRVLAGFSQGASFALRYGLGHPDSFVGIVALSPSHVGNLDEAGPGRASDRATAIFLAKGLDDPVVPVEEMRAGCRRLERAGHAVAYHEYPIGHEISLAEVRDVRRWLQRLCPVPRPVVTCAVP